MSKRLLLDPIPADKAPPRPWYLDYMVHLEPKEFGAWRIERQDVTHFYPPLPPKASIMVAGRPMPGVWSGSYTSLVRDEYYEDEGEYDGEPVKYGRTAPVIWMSDSPNEIFEQVRAIRRLRGRVLIGGLGIGVMVKAALSRPDVERVDVI